MKEFLAVTEEMQPYLCFPCSSILNPGLWYVLIYHLQHYAGWYVATHKCSTVSQFTFVWFYVNQKN